MDRLEVRRQLYRALFFEELKQEQDRLRQLKREVERRLTQLQCRRKHTPRQRRQRKWKSKDRLTRGGVQYG